LKRKKEKREKEKIFARVQPLPFHVHAQHQQKNHNETLQNCLGMQHFGIGQHVRQQFFLKNNIYDY